MFAAEFNTSTPPGPVDQTLPCVSTFSPSEVPRRPLSRSGFGVEEGAAVSHGAVGLHFVGHNPRVTSVANGDVEGPLVVLFSISMRAT
jgi:hypothetical protein